MQIATTFLLIILLLDLSPKVCYHYNAKKPLLAVIKKEKNMKTKLLSLLFAMMFILGMLASCNPEEEGDGGDEYDDVIIPAGAPTYNVTWDKTELKYALTANDTSGELESGCKKYYSGTEVSATQEKVDGLVSARNAAAAKSANVSVRFDYDTVSANWGGNIETIVAKTTTSSSQSPDIYASYVYDISCAQLRGCFANLIQTGKANYFRFAQGDYNPVSDNYFDAAAGEGYFYEYMKSLSLSDDKMFILASNYCTDLVRSFLVVPMNVEQMATLVGTDGNGENKSYTGDMQQVSDFYDLVWRTASKAAVNEKYNEGFTYNVIAHYAEKFYSQADSSDVLSGKTAFAIGSGTGLPASGLLYTTSVTIVKKTADEANPGQYIYTYPKDNDNLKEFSANLAELFNNRNGVLAVDSKQAGVAGVYSTTLLAIRNAFSKGNVLFGGIVALGSLDHTDYQKMRVEGKAMGFGVLPVPLYRSTDAEGNPEEYKTLVHNIAKVIAISKTTQNFTQCTAYLDYLSRMSQEVIDEYYNVKLVSNVQGFAAAFNENMLVYIRNHVRNCFDKTIEDSVASFVAATEGDVKATELKFHEIINSKRYNHPNLFNDYVSSSEKKEAYLKDVVNTWNNFTD